MWPLITIAIAFVIIVVILYIDNRRKVGRQQRLWQELERKKKEDDFKWELPGEWDVKTLSQETGFNEVVNEIKSIRSEIHERWKECWVGGHYFASWKRSLPSEYIIGKLDRLKAKTERVGLNISLIKVAAGLVVKELMKYEFPKEATEIAEWYNL